MPPRWKLSCPPGAREPTRRSTRARTTRRPKTPSGGPRAAPLQPPSCLLAPSSSCVIVLPPPPPPPPRFPPRPLLLSFLRSLMLSCYHHTPPPPPPPHPPPSAAPPFRGSPPFPFPSLRTLVFIEVRFFSHRRKRARERQQKLLAEFASKQKVFMEQALKRDPSKYPPLY